MARLDADMIVFRRQNVKVRELLEDIKAELETRAEKEKKEIILTGDETSRMICDRDWMQEAVSNLVKNALDHTKEGGRVEITWEETGVGMRVQAVSYTHLDVYKRQLQGNDFSRFCLSLRANIAPYRNPCKPARLQER